VSTARLRGVEMLCFVGVMVRHGFLLLFRGPARWRLETFGLYMPSLPGMRPWWRVNGRALRQLVRQRAAYSRWLWEMHALQLHGDSGWWRVKLGVSYQALRFYMAGQNGPQRDNGTGS
jgi:hypothetical protein